MDDVFHFVNVFSDFVIQRDTESMVDVIISLGHLVPFCGVIGKSLGIFVKLSGQQRSPISDIQDKLNKLCLDLTAMNRKLDELFSHVTNTIIISKYKNEKEKLHQLHNLIDRYNTGPNEITQKDLMTEFQTNNIIHFIHWIHREVVTGDVEPITKIMTVDYDLTYFRNWKQRLTQDFAQAILMHCFRTCIESNEQTKAVLMKDKEDFIRKFQEFLNKLYQLECHLCNNFWTEKAIAEIGSFMNRNSSLGYQSFSNSLYEFLCNKYFWRGWAVAAWENRSKEYIQTDFIYTPDPALYVRYWKNERMRLFVGSSNTVNGEKFCTNIDETLQKINDNVRFDSDAVVWGGLRDDRIDRVSEKFWETITPYANGLVVIDRAPNFGLGYACGRKGIAVFEKDISNPHVFIAIAKDNYNAECISDNYRVKRKENESSEECICL